jgi:hypothetical protein
MLQGLFVLKQSVSVVSIPQTDVYMRVKVAALRRLAVKAVDGQYRAEETVAR